MKSAFITGFWGSSDPSWYVGRTLAGREEELAERWRTKTLPEAIKSIPMMRGLDAFAFVFGTDALMGVVNEAVDAQLSVFCMDESPGAHWRYKLKAIAEALLHLDEVVWIDLDSTQLAPLPCNFWQAMRDRAPIQTRIRQYHRRKCHHWRHEHPRTLCSAAFIYCRDRSIILRAIDWLENLETWERPNGSKLRPDEAICLTEEHALAWTIDQIEGGWKGPEFYHGKYDPPWYTIGGEIFKCETPVFTAR